MLDWFEYAVLASLLIAGFWLSCRNILKKEKDHYSFSVFLQIMPIIFWLPLLFFEKPVIPSENVGWLLILFAGIGWAIQQLMVFQSLKIATASVREPIYQTKMVWAVLIGVFFLGEVFPLGGTTGIALLLCGAVLTAYKKPIGEISAQGVTLVLASAFLTGVVSVLDKLALSHMSVTLYAIVVTLICCAIIVALARARNRTMDLKSFFLRHKNGLILASFFGATSYWFQIKAISLGPISSVVPLLNLSLVFTTIGGIVLLQERQGIGVKLAGIALALAGAWMLRPA